MVDSLRWAERNKIPKGTSTWSQSESNYYRAPAGTSVWFNNSGPAKPILPIKPPGNGGGGENNPVKTSDITKYESTDFSTRADLSIDERLAFMALTGNEILEVSRTFDFSQNSLGLNKNVVDAVAVVNSTSPIQIIKSQNSNTDYLAKTLTTTEGATITPNQITGKTDIVIPPTVIPAPITTNNSAPVQTSTQEQQKIQIQQQAPAQVVPVVTTPPHKIITITPLSAKRGSKIKVTHQNCNQPTNVKKGITRIIKIGTVTVSASSQKTTTFELTIPISTSGANSLTIGQSYYVSVDINGVVATSTQQVTIIA